LLFSWKPSPLRPSRFSLELLLLPPRSALNAVPPRLTSRLPNNVHALLHMASSHLKPWLSIGRTLERHPFSGLIHSQVSCNTLLGGCRLLWPPSCCLNESTPFMVSDERTVGHLISASGSSPIASSAYQKRPTQDTHSASMFT